ncbi:hypothetical protein [Actinacidiphila sp. ITFR-21]|uniref:hypothetical protein n=1 Tax=Actinacidiphila sp. ITFR-21 TaxID=3075199 RepID=UPI00288C48BC|nr:hypothetical protein [Streptomyces sp. ITFR-21]WNI16372.1 hypothetical protein RLT57_13145 [Streptomyces sp. ITFR-21]
MTIPPNTPDDAHGMDPQTPRNTRDADGRPGHDPGGHPADPLADLFGETAGEEALRTLMHGAVAGLHGSPDALDRLRRAIPIRRQHHRQALVGAAAAVLLAGMAVPALLRATGTGQSADATAASVASAHTGAPGEDGHTDAWGDSGALTGKASPDPDGTPTPEQPTTGGTSGPTSRPAVPSDPAPPVPECSSTQLGQGASQAGAPDSGGRVYGWFRVANVSDTPCTVPSGGVVQAVAQGSADPSRIQIVDHTVGDAAGGLPVAPGGGPVVLSPGENYEVAFAWVPSSDGPGGCPVVSTTPPATPTPTDTPTAPPGTDAGAADGSTTGSPGGSAGSGNATSPQLVEDTPVSETPGSVALNHTPAAGAPVVAGPVIQDACAGTVYTTTAIPEPAGSPVP